MANRTNISEERMGQIALMFLRKKLEKDGIRIGNFTHRQISSTAAELGISVEEATAFAEIIVRDMVEQTFAKK